MIHPALLTLALLWGQSLPLPPVTGPSSIQVAALQAASTTPELRPSRTLRVSEVYAGALAFSPDGRWLVTGAARE